MKLIPFRLRIGQFTGGVLHCAVLLCMLPGCVGVARISAIRQLNQEYAEGHMSEKDYRSRMSEIDLASVNALNQGTAPENLDAGGGYTYVQTPQRQPGGGYTPQPMPHYVQAPPFHPGGGYTPAPQQSYVQGPAYHPGGGDYTPSAAPQYTQTPARQPGGGYTPAPQQSYVQTPGAQPSGTYNYDPATHQTYYVTPSSKSGGGGPASTTNGSTYVPIKTSSSNPATSTTSAPPKYVANDPKHPTLITAPPPGKITANPAITLDMYQQTITKLSKTDPAAAAFRRYWDATVAPVLLSRSISQVTPEQIDKIIQDQLKLKSSLNAEDIWQGSKLFYQAVKEQWSK